MLQDNKVVSQDSRNLALLNWLGCLFTLFVIPLMFYLAKTDDAYVREQAKEAINLSVTALLLLIGSFIYLLLVSLILMPLEEIIPSFIFTPLGFFALLPSTIVVPITIGAFFVFCIKGVISNYKCKDYKVPFKIQLLK